MRAAALVLLAIIGFVNSQQVGNGRFNQDQGRAYGGWSQGRKDFGVADPLGAGTGFGGQQQYPSLQQQPGNNGLNQQNAGQAPYTGGSSGQIRDFGPQVVNTGPAQGNVNHVNAGAQPQNTGGSSGGLQDVPLGPVQTGQTNNVNMQNAGAPPEAGQGNQNSGEYVYDWGQPAVGGVAANGATGNNAPAVAPLGGEAVYGQGTGGNSGNGGNPYNGGQYSDNAGQNSPLGGAEISDFTQKEAGSPAHSTGAASISGATVGVVIAVLVLIGIVGVAAVFLIKQRRSRMNMSRV